MHLVLQLTLIAALAILGINGHGYLAYPASRNSAWRYGFNTTKNPWDNVLVCGSMSIQHNINGGKCGICGDDYSITPPRPHERGGGYGEGVITATFSQGQVVPVQIVITASHKGYYEYRLCDNSNPQASDSQECLDKYLLELADGSGTRYTQKAAQVGQHTTAVRLPAGVHCTHCVLQWYWVTGNNWGYCPDGLGKRGCGPQQTFVNCADIRILPEGEALPGPTEDPTKLDLSPVEYKGQDKSWTLYQAQRKEERRKEKKRNKKRWQRRKNSA